jgi:hypothetical protein
MLNIKKGVSSIQSQKVRLLEPEEASFPKEEHSDISKLLDSVKKRTTNAGVLSWKNED